MFAIIETGGKQYKVTEQDIIFVEKLDCEEGAEIVFDKVVAVSTEDGFKAGTPYVDGASVKGTVVKIVVSHTIILLVKNRMFTKRWQNVV